MRNIVQVGWTAAWLNVAAVFSGCSLPPTGGLTDASPSANEHVCSPVPPTTAQPPTCNTLFNTATWTLSTSHPALTPPSPQGGAFVDGIYECTALDTYGTDETRERVRSTVVVTDQGTTFLWANDALDGNTNMIETFRGNVTATFQGNLVTFTETCGVAVIPLSAGFTATPNGFFLFDPGDPERFTYTFSRSRCNGTDSSVGPDRLSSLRSPTSDQRHFFDTSPHVSGRVLDLETDSRLPRPAAAPRRTHRVKADSRLNREE